MKSRKKSTPKASPTPSLPLPPGWDETAGLRETFLHHFPRPEHAAALQLVIALFLELGLESPQLLETDPPRTETPTRLELASVIRDLRHSQGSLQQIACEPDLSELSPVDAALARFAGKQAQELALIAGALERALG